jgi:hypothetical protein
MGEFTVRASQHVREIQEIAANTQCGQDANNTFKPRSVSEGQTTCDWVRSKLGLPRAFEGEGEADAYPTVEKNLPPLCIACLGILNNGSHLRAIKKVLEPPPQTPPRWQW